MKTYIDKTTSLEWQIELPLSMDWKDAMKYCESLGKRWRLPTLKELINIVDYTCYKPSINVKRFPNTRASGYWSSTTYASSTYYAWLVTFSYGGVYNYGKTGYGYVRAVRSVRAGKEKG